MHDDNERMNSAVPPVHKVWSTMVLSAVASSSSIQVHLSLYGPRVSDINHISLAYLMGPSKIMAIIKYMTVNEL